MKMVRTVVSAATATTKSEIVNSKYEYESQPQALVKEAEAVKTLNTLQTNAQTLEKIRSERDKYAHLNIPNMLNYAKRVGISEEAVNSLNVVHVSGTKGKGSTCAFCESILGSYGYRTGFYSSPHLVEVRERLRINGSPIHRDSFASYFWDVYTKLEESKEHNEGKMPNYFGFLTVMALHVFLQEKVDVAIMEVGIGGQYDCTNMIKQPVVCGVSSLGLDHTSILGTTIDKIAWHKAGIFKPGVPAFTAPQPPKAMQMLKNRALDIGVPLTVCPDLREYDCRGRPLQLGIKGSMQRVNASLALQLANLWIKRVKDRALSNVPCVRDDEDIRTAEAFPLSSPMMQGLEQCCWLGRNQKLVRPGITYYLDGAHTLESIQQCVEWFQGEMCLERSTRKKESYKVLIFNTTGDRDSHILLEPLQVCDFDAVLFCPNVAFLSSNSADQNNRNVTKESQINKCLANKHEWEKLSQKACQTDLVSVDKQPEAGSSLDHVIVNGISVVQHAVSGDPAVRSESIVLSECKEDEKEKIVLGTDTVGCSYDVGPTSMKRPRTEKVEINGHQFNIGQNLDLNCNHHPNFKRDTEVVIDENILESQIHKQPVIHAFPSISHCIQWIMKGKELRDNLTQGRRSRESVEKVLYDSVQGDLEDSDKSLPSIGDKDIDLLITGSIHLVGGALRVIEGESACS